MAIERREAAARKRATVLDPADVAGRADPTVAARSGGVIGIELPSGIRVSVDATVDGDALSRVIGILTR